MEKTANPDRQIRCIRDEKAAEAVEHSLTDVQAVEFRHIRTHHMDVFRLELGRDLPVNVASLMARLKKDAVLVKTSLRRYPPVHVDFLKKHVEEVRREAMLIRTIAQPGRLRRESSPRRSPVNTV
ncbi:hypothetical protein H310_02996 [Aphanomyces invadans]|uniref:Uncharacterized protein n=1 Tax=Aphanomyces invadans TaxID=157072 RepID=A0A024UMM1_9STRA|nr:hypothetical protein H310_02996 [Aphanomyces invadans]ETW06863.1 hypothetical protein H310_02996 [Aphanomyces invadans]|eukprot:XP_008864938.1 hypothetical protein H310_02996 [Aphanomyces invadans]